MVSGENGLFVWVYSVGGLRLDFGILSIQTNHSHHLPLSTGYQSLTLIPLRYIPIQPNHSYHIPLSTGYQSLILIPLRYIPIQTNHSYHLPLSTSGENGLFVWVYSVGGLRLDFGIQYSMVSSKNGLFVWVYSVVGLRLDFGHSAIYPYKQTILTTYHWVLDTKV
jgi:hypothetical protein